MAARIAGTKAREPLQRRDQCSNTGFVRHGYVWWEIENVLSGLDAGRTFDGSVDHDHVAGSNGHTLRAGFLSAMSATAGRRPKHDESGYYREYRLFISHLTYLYVVTRISVTIMTLPSGWPD
jgi:hypothetical protein